MLEKMLNEVKDTNTTLANCMIIQCASKRYESAVAREMEEVLVSMPIGKLMRPNEIAKMSKYNSCQFVTAMLRKLKMANLVKREEIPCEPFTIMVGGREKFVDGEWKLIDQKPKVIDKVVAYTRLV